MSDTGQDNREQITIADRMNIQAESIVSEVSPESRKYFSDLLEKIKRSQNEQPEGTNITSPI